MAYPEVVILTRQEGDPQVIFNPFRKDPRRAVIAKLYRGIADASRSPGLYGTLGIPDTL